MRDALRLPPNMVVKITDKYETDGGKKDWSYTFIEVEMRVYDVHHPDKMVTVHQASPVYNSHTTVEEVLHRIGYVVRELWLHELQEWVKVGDVWLLGNPHGT